MSTSKYIDRICVIAVVVALLISVLFLNGAALGIQVQAKTMGYEDRLFDTTMVHTIDIVIDDWDAFLTTAQSEEYSVCDVVIDGEAFSNVGIRGKGNTSLSTVSSMDSDRYSFKIEFDQYDSTKSYYGLDKLSLNNLIQDNTMMKDYLTYQMMNEFDVAAPLCSYVYITVNGEDWGLYLAVEAVEESFLQRNYGSDYGDLYKPDSMNMGGGRGNGKGFDFEDFMGTSEQEDASGSTMPGMPDNFDPFQTGGMIPGQSGSWGQQGGQTPPDASIGSAPENGFDPSQMGGMRPGGTGGFGLTIDEESLRTAFEELGLDTALLDGIDFDNITMETIQTVISSLDQDTMQKLMEKLMGDVSFGDFGNFGGMGMGSGETKLQYIDDNPDSYSTIFSSAKTDVTDADQTRLITALKDLSEGKDSAVDAEAVIRYFVVHNYVVNADSYTGSMVHNYYLYEEDGQLSMIPWDYNLAFGTFQGGSASSMVNDGIDAPLSVTGSDRPMIDWIFDSEEYTELYHQYFREFLDTVDASSIITQAKALIAPYAEKDPTKFCTYEEFETGVETLTNFCDLRSQSVAAQLAGEDGTVDASSITLSNMGTMNNGFGGGRGQMPGMGGNRTKASEGTSPDNTVSGDMQMPQMPGGQGGMQMPGQGGMPQMPGQSGTVNNTSSTDETTGGSPQFPGFGGQGGTEFPEGMEIPEGIELPEGMEIPEGMGNMQPGQNGNSQGGFPDRGQTGTTPTQGNNQWVLLTVTIVILAVGLLFAFKFKR